MSDLFLTDNDLKKIKKDLNCSALYYDEISKFIVKSYIVIENHFTNEVFSNQDQLLFHPLYDYVIVEQLPKMITMLDFYHSMQTNKQKYWGNELSKNPILRKGGNGLMVRKIIKKDGELFILLLTVIFDNSIDMLPWLAKFSKLINILDLVYTNDSAQLIFETARNCLKPLKVNFSRWHKVFPHPKFSDLEWRHALLLAEEAYSNKEIAKQLNLSHRTVEGYVCQLKTILNTPNRDELRKKLKEIMFNTIFYSCLEK